MACKDKAHLQFMQRNNPVYQIFTSYVAVKVGTCLSSGYEATDGEDI